jgi:hypothetical protein
LIRFKKNNFYKMKLFIVGILLVIICCNSHTKYQNQIKIVDTILNSLYNLDSNKVKSLLGSDLNELGMNSSILESYLITSYRVLRKYGLPKKEDYIFKEYSPNDQSIVDIIVPIKSTDHKTNVAEIYIFFAKYLPINKASHFWIVLHNKPEVISPPNKY